MPTQLNGRTCDMDRLQAIADKHGLLIVEDAAHALGARYKGRRVGSLGHVGFFSFAGKPITVCGQAGGAVTDDSDLAAAMASLRVHGWRQEVGNVWHLAERVGLNLRTSEILAAIGRLNLTKLDRWTAARSANASRYNLRLASGSAPVVAPITRTDQEPGWLHYVRRAPRRDELRRYLSARGIETSILYPVPIHLQPTFKDIIRPFVSYPVSESLCGDMLALPSHPWMTPHEVDYVADAILEFYGA